MKAILNATLYTPEERITTGVILIEDQRIYRIGSADTVPIPPSAEWIDAQGYAVAPGLLDLHTYGCRGAQLTAPERAAEELQALASNVTQFGVTGFLISPPMGSVDHITAMLRALADAIPHMRGARCLGIHLEGPYLDPAQRGAFPREVLREPNLEEMARWYDAARGWLKIVTLAPNLPNSIKVARFLRERGVVPSLGHTSADYHTARAALEPNGPFALVTHLFNAMTGLHHRKPGVVGAALTSDVPLMLICDGEHVHPAVVDVLVRTRGTRDLVLVTDAIAGAGMEDGEFWLFDQRVSVRNGRATLSDGTLAGSVLTLNRAVVNTRSFAGIQMGAALAMATRNPASLLNLDLAGTLAQGAIADIVLFDETTSRVARTLVGGDTVFRADLGESA